MRNLIIIPFTLLLFTMPTQVPAQANIEVDLSALQPQSSDLTAIKARVKEAYGGRKLENLKSIRIQTDRGLAWPGQGQTADFVEFVSHKFDVQIDLKNERASVESRLEQNGGIYNNRNVSAPGGGIASIDYRAGTYEIDEDATYFRTFAVELTGSDTLIARALVTDPHDLMLEEPAYYLGKWHDKVTFKISPEGLPGTAFIERDSGLITRFEVTLWSGQWNAVFSDFRTSKGLTYARKRMDFRDDKMVQTDPNRRHSFNSVRWSRLKIEDDLTAPSPLVDMSEMTVDTISDTVHHVGQDDYSTFIDAGDYIIATNPYSGLKDRFEAYQNAAAVSKPLRYALATHHHSDHLSGVDEAIKLGATVVGTPMTIKTLQADDQYEAVNFKTLEPNDSVGPVKIYTVPTSHAVEYAIIYLPDSKVLYQDDHYYPTTLDGPSHVNQAGLVFQDRVTTLGLNVDVLLSGHARKAERWVDFEAAAAKETLGEDCPRNREICQK